MPGVFL